MTTIYPSNQCFNKDWFVHFYQINLINNKKLVQSKLTLPDTSISNITGILVAYHHLGT